jgi:hypothetical protein
VVVRVKPGSAADLAGVNVGAVVAGSYICRPLSAQLKHFLWDILGVFSNKNGSV